MNRTQKTALVLTALFVIVGCDNIGNAPMGETPEQTKARMDKLSLEDHAKEIKKLSMPNKLKREAIIELYQKAGKEAPAEILADVQDTGAAPGVPATK